MSKLVATLVASMFSVAAFAQTNATPPTQAPSGTKMNKSEEASMKKDDMSKGDMQKMDMNKGDKMGMSTDKKEGATTTKRHARKMKRAEEVGDKPIN